MPEGAVGIEQHRLVVGHWATSCTGFPDDAACSSVADHIAGEPPISSWNGQKKPRTLPSAEGSAPEVRPLSSSLVPLADYYDCRQSGSVFPLSWSLKNISWPVYCHPVRLLNRNSFRLRPFGEESFPRRSTRDLLAGYVSALSVAPHTARFCSPLRMTVGYSANVFG